MLVMSFLKQIPLLRGGEMTVTFSQGNGAQVPAFGFIPVTWFYSANLITVFVETHIILPEDAGKYSTQNQPTSSDMSGVCVQGSVLVIYPTEVGVLHKLKSCLKLSRLLGCKAPH